MTPTPTWQRRLGRDLLALGLGAASMLSLPPWGLWPLAPVGLGLWLRFCNRGTQRWRDRLEAALAYWLGAWSLGLFWMVELTVPGWIVAVPVETLLLGLACSLVAPDGWRRAVSVPAALVVGEAVRWRWPFEGVPMSNLALGQVEGPWLPSAVLAGPLVVVALVGVGAVIVERLLAREWSALSWPALTAIAVPIAALAWPATSVDGQVQVAVVQAGGELGTNITTPQASVRRRHLDAVQNWNEGADVMLWSESSTSADAPLEQSPQLAELEALAAERDLVLVANFYERTADNQNFRNATVAINPADRPQGGLADRYDKAHLVPFGEYVPLRSLIEPFVDLSLVAREAIAGEGPGLLRTAVGDIAVATSFEVYFSELVRDGVRAGGQIIANPTLASSYSTSAVPAQSLASARLRAVESGRWVLQASTTGYSAIVSPSGEVVQRSDLREATVLSQQVELRSGTTPAMAMGPWPMLLVAAVALAGTVARPRAQRRRSRA